MTVRAADASDASPGSAGSHVQSPALLTILGGLHGTQVGDRDGDHALSVPLEGALSLGGALEADVVLSDPGLEPIHLRLRPAEEGGEEGGEGPHKRRGIDITALAPGVEARGGGEVHDLVVDETVTLPLPVEIRIGGPADHPDASPTGANGLRLRVHRPAAAPRPPGRALVPYVAGAVTATPRRAKPHPILLALPLLGLLMLLPLSRGLLGEGDADASPPLATARLAPVGPEPGRAEAVVAARAELAARLATEGLGRVTLRVEGGTIIAGGIVPADRTDDWSRVQFWFDGAHGRDAVLVSDVTSARGNAVAAPRIEAAWFGSSPYVMARGRRYAVGETLPGGWTIEEIRPDFVRVSDGGRSMNVAY